MRAGEIEKCVCVDGGNRNANKIIIFEIAHSSGMTSGTRGRHEEVQQNRHIS